MNLLGLKGFKEGRSHSQGGTDQQQWHFLAEYKDLIFSQICNHRFGDAMKTFRKIKYFKLDSMNIKDVFECIKPFSMDENDYFIRCVIGELCTLKCQVESFQHWN